MNPAYRLDEAFLVLATQNPIEQEGTYHLPEAQVDRFMLKVNVGYPTRQEERVIIDRMMAEEPPVVRPVVNTQVLNQARRVARSVHMEDSLKEYIISVIFATREPEAHRLAELKPLIAFGASPRASILLALAAKAHAFLRGRGFVVPEDIKDVIYDVLRHRIIVTYEAEAEDVTSETVIGRVLQAVEVP